MASQFIYTILQNGEMYSCAYTRYQDALTAVQEKNKEILEESLDGARLEGRHSTEFDSNLEENIETGITYLYIEYGQIRIEIHKLPIVFAFH